MTSTDASPARAPATSCETNGAATDEQGTTPHQQAAKRELATERTIDCSIRIGGIEFILVPATRAHVGGTVGGGPQRGVDITKRRLFEARRESGLTQAQLAERLGVSQSMVCQAESGQSRVSDRYVSRVVEACQLPPDWGLPKESSEALSGWDLDPKDIAGLDPDTLVPVRRGSERDLELRRTFAWWEGFVDES